MKAELVPLNGDAPIPIVRDITVVGRREFCDVRINHPTLSKRHCVLVRTDGLMMVRDLATTNGTKVNGQRVLWAALLPNDRLTLGGYKVRVYLGPDDQPSPSERAAAGPRAAASGPGPHPVAAVPVDDFATPSTGSEIEDADDVILLGSADYAPEGKARGVEDGDVILLD
jgi:pSer/pThr/pTyr-binding forkhead associated (FHA) protein